MATASAKLPEEDNGVNQNSGRAPRIPTDEEILLQLHDPQMESLGAELLVRKYELRCLRIAGHWCRNDTVARDLAQDVLARFIERETDPAQASFTVGKSIGAYLAVAIRNAYRDYVEAQKREEKCVPATEANALESVPSTEILALNRLIAIQQTVALKQCLSQLAPDERHLLTLRFLEEPGWTLKEIADELGIAVSTVTYRIDQILRTLKRKLKKAGVEGVFNAKDQ